MKKLKVAVIGVGNMGKNHVRTYKKLKGADLVAVSDIDTKEGKKVARQNNIQFFSNYRSIINKIPDLDIVSVVVPTKYHAEVASFFLEKGVNTLIEKPMADTIEGAKKIIKAARKSGSKATVGYVERFNPAILKLKQIINERKLGKVTSIVIKRVGVFPPSVSDANVLIDLAIHDVDISNYLLGKMPKQVFKHSIKMHTKSQEDTGEIFLVYDGAAAFIQVNWVTPVKIRTMSVTGTRGYCEIDYISQELTMYEAKVKKEYGTFSEFLKFSNPVKTKIKVEKKEPLKLELESFLDVVRNDRQPVVSLSDALKSLKICLEA